MPRKEMAYDGAEDSEYEESWQCEDGVVGNGYREDEEPLSGPSEGTNKRTGEVSATQWEAIQEAFRQLRRF